MPRAGALHRICAVRYRLDLTHEHLRIQADQTHAHMKIAVFGKPGGGKSTLSRQIAAATKLPLHQLDLVQYQRGGIKVSDDEFIRRHAEIMAQEHWVVDGFGNPQAFAAMLHTADALVYVERFLLTHYWWVTKRSLKSPFSKPLGWPEGSPLLSSTISSYRFLRRSPQFWNSALKARLLALRPAKRVYVVRKQSDVAALLAELGAWSPNGEA
jgi:adenylate kinase family enzyme